MKDQEQYEEYKQAIAAEKQKAPLLRSAELLNKLESFVEQYETELRIAADKAERDATKSDHSERIKELYADFAEVIKPLQKMHEELVECRDDLLVNTMSHLSELQDYVNAHARSR